jgi:hypothetical protein
MRYRGSVRHWAIMIVAGCSARATPPPSNLAPRVAQVTIRFGRQGEGLPRSVGRGIPTDCPVDGPVAGELFDPIVAFARRELAAGLLGRSTHEIVVVRGEAPTPAGD